MLDPALLLAFDKEDDKAASCIARCSVVNLAEGDLIGMVMLSLSPAIEKQTMQPFVARLGWKRVACTVYNMTSHSACDMRSARTSLLLRKAMLPICRLQLDSIDAKMLSLRTTIFRCTGNVEDGARLQMGGTERKTLPVYVTNILQYDACFGSLDATHCPS